MNNSTKQHIHKLETAISEIAKKLQEIELLVRELDYWKRNVATPMLNESNISHSH